MPQTPRSPNASSAHAGPPSDTRPPHGEPGGGNGSNPQDARSSRDVRAVVAANAVLTAIGYVAYPVLLALLFAFDQQLLARCIAVPAAGFATVSIFRSLYDAPRPYELGGPEPPAGKRTRGKSFPSRHTFCMFAIAFTWLVWQPVVGALLLACGCFMAAVRVRLGVHFPRDVVAGAACAAAFSLIGYCVIPW